MKYFSVSLKYLESMIVLGFIRMATRYIGAGIKEISQSIFPALQVAELQKYIPEITRSDVSRGPAGKFSFLFFSSFLRLS